MAEHEERDHDEASPAGAPAQAENDDAAEPDVSERAPRDPSSGDAAQQRSEESGGDEAAGDEPGDASRTLRAVGAALGGWARRVGDLVADAAGRPVVPEALREPLSSARTLRREGKHADALTMLRDLQPRYPGDPFLRFSMGLCHLYDLVSGGRPLEALSELQRELGDGLGRGPAQLFEGARCLFSGKPEAANDQLRRAVTDLGRVPEGDQVEARFMLHLIGALAHLRLGNEDRALRELRKARVRMPTPASLTLRRLVTQHGVDLSLAAGEITDAESWVRETLSVDPDDRVARVLLAKVLASKGDRIGAHALIEALDPGPDLDPTRLWVALTVGAPERDEDAQRIAMRLVQSRPEDPEVRRWWALTELARLKAEDREPEAALRTDILQALADATEASARATRDRFLQELAYVCLQLDAFEPAAVGPIEARLQRDPATAPEELRLLRARSLLRDGTVSSTDFIPGEPPRFRGDPDIGGPFGPDPLSPVRHPDSRLTMRAAQRSLAAAELCLHREQPELAQDLLVEALIERSDLRRARSLLGSLVVPTSAARLEDLLGAATSLLAGIPNRVLGLSLQPVQDALGRVIAARERLARPLTIAIMGEFSAGKSTFVNALLGEVVAPMGVLPTTTTINVFRRGTSGSARVHYRDGRISVLDADEVHDFLHSLDDTEASRIRHMEIERTGKRMGDASVVDTPGLNALDEYHERVAREFLDEADAVVWVFSATRGGAASEAGILGELRRSGRQVLGVLNKVDTLNEAEQSELADYLREQLGEVLVEVVPLRGEEALKWRTAEHPGGEDPFAQAERALDEHFLQNARELKRELTARRLQEALGSARTAVNETIEALHRRAEEASDAQGKDRSSVPAVLMRFADAIAEGMLGLDDVLTREALGLGVLQTGRGRSKGPLDPLDVEYLASSLRDAATDALARALSEISLDDVAAGEVLDRQFVPWARGHLEGLLSGGFVESTLEEHGKKVQSGEAAVRSGFREALEPIARAWAEQARGLVHAVEHARRRADRQAASAPRAEALRLRSAVVTAIDGLHAAAGELQS